jgi:hypothetical protein
MPRTDADAKTPLMETFEGGCHCGRVRMRVTGDLADTVDCNCSMCTKKGFLHLIVPRDRFQLLAGRDELTTYRFNTGVAQHTFCRHCGIYAFYVPRSDPDKIDVNVRCLDDVDLRQVHAKPFDGQHWEETMARRNA